MEKSTKSFGTDGEKVIWKGNERKRSFENIGIENCFL
ncbi:hypothetical protein FUSO7_01725 [Fusobacterium necrophorum BFTR-2]|nr:hypothetical protein FUSO7_01725 [Fusobacterium necrophorum BFTR-2]